MPPTDSYKLPPPKPPEPSIRRDRSLTALKPHGVVVRLLVRIEAAEGKRR